MTTTVEPINDCDTRALLGRGVLLLTLDQAHARATADAAKADAAYWVATTRAEKLEAQHAHGEACRALRRIREERIALGVVT